MGEQCEGHRFLSVRVDPELVSKADGHGGEEVPQVVDEHRVATSTTAEDDLIDRRQPTTIGKGNAMGREGSRRRDQVAGMLPHGNRGGGIGEDSDWDTCLGQEALSKWQTVALAPGRLRWRALEVGILEKLGKEPLVDPASRGERAIAVKASGTIGQELHESIDHHGPGPGIESKHVVEPATRRQIGDVRDAADVLYGSGTRSVTQGDPIEVGDERRALATGRDIGLAEVRDDGNAGTECDDGRAANLKG